MTAEETEFGLLQSTTFANGFVRRLALFMPNALYFKAGAGILRGFTSFLWNVPIDDVSHKMFFLLIAAHLTPEIGARVAQGVRAGREYLSELPPVEEVIQRVISGQMRWEDIEDRPDLVLIEDGIILVGQGVISDRSEVVWQLRRGNRATAADSSRDGGAQRGRAGKEFRTSR